MIDFSECMGTARVGSNPIVRVIFVIFHRDRVVLYVFCHLTKFREIWRRFDGAVG